MVDNRKYILNTSNNTDKLKKKLLVENVTLSQLPSDVPSISEFYADQNIFITGGTGFMGKVLIEKLLRSCPKIKGIYLLLRSKKNYTDEQRLNKIFNIPLFDRLKNEQPEALLKVKVIQGDISEIEFGLSDSDMEFLINEINIVFHVAASVRFDEPLKKAILINTRGTREMLRIIRKMQNLKVFLHTSTTYCNIDKNVDAIEEKVYKASTNWETMIKAAENMDENVLNFLEKKILNKYPNTYVFVKSLAEDIVAEHCEHIPIVVFRPTVVISTLREPIPGWVDNFNGPMGLFTGTLTGLLHTVFIDADKKLDWIPVDTAINGMIASAWYKAFEQTQRNQCLVINTSTTDHVSLDNTILFDGVEVGKKIPFSKLLWYPFILKTRNKYLYSFYFLTLHLIPAIFLSILLKLNKQKLNLFKLYRRIFYATMCLVPFLLNEWTFKNDNFKSLQAILKPEDTEKFTVDYTGYDFDEYLEIPIRGIGQYLLKDESYARQDTLDKRLFNLKIIRNIESKLHFIKLNLTHTKMSSLLFFYVF